MFKEALAVYLLGKILGRERAEKIGRVSARCAPKIASVVLFLAATGHTLRLVFGFDIYVAGWLVPLWLSLVAMLLTTYLSFNLWRIGGRD